MEFSLEMIFKEECNKEIEINIDEVWKELEPLLPNSWAKFLLRMFDYYVIN
jgi:hypothetical protein